jgi:putative transposase
MTRVQRTAGEGMSFVTTATAERRPIFEISRVADLFVETLKHYRMLGHYKLHAYVVMPDHVHLVLTPRAMTLEQAVNLIKTGFEHKLETELTIWEPGFTGYAIASNRDMEIVRAYLHELPVRAELVAAAELYPHSSAYRHASYDQSAARPPASVDSQGISAGTTTSVREKAS